MTGPPGDMTETPYRGWTHWLAAARREARGNAPRREELGVQKRCKADFEDTRQIYEYRTKFPVALASVHSFLRKCFLELYCFGNGQARIRSNRADRAGRHFLHDPLDGVSAAAALGAASEAVIDLPHPRPLLSVRKRGPNLMVTEHIARADDHNFVLDISSQGRNEENQNEATTPSHHDSYEVPSGHVGAACSSYLACCGAPHNPSPSAAARRQPVGSRGHL
jgi:hypothetical protein